MHSVSGVDNQVKAILAMTREPEEVLAERSERAAKWCESNISYSAFNNQLEEVIAHGEAIVAEGVAYELR